MRPYRRLGDIPRKRHMRFGSNGRLFFEELFGREGFSGPSSLIYHRNMPEGAQDVSEGPADLLTPEHEQVHETAHLQEVLCVNGSADEVLFVHSGKGVLRSQFGRMPFDRHDYIVIPRGTIYRIDLDEPTASRLLCLEVSGFVDVPDRYRARNGQLTEIAPYSERDFHPPTELESGEGGVEVWLKG